MGLGKQLWYINLCLTGQQVTPGRFDYLIYVNCREMALLLTLVVLTWSIALFKIQVDQSWTLFLYIQRSFCSFLMDFLSFSTLSVTRKRILVPIPWKGSQKRLLHSLMRTKLFPESSLLITAQPRTMKKLHSLLKKSTQTEILWFTNVEKRAYFLSQFSGANAAMRVLYDLWENEGLDIMSSLPIIS